MEAWDIDSSTVWNTYFTIIWPERTLIQKNTELQIILKLLNMDKFKFKSQI